MPILDPSLYASELEALHKGEYVETTATPRKSNKPSRSATSSSPVMDAPQVARLVSQEEGPSPLPVPRKRKKKRLTSDFDEPANTDSDSRLELFRFNPLPEDPKEFDEVIRPLRVMVRPVVTGLSKLAVTFETEPFDKDEMASGEIAFAALMHQYGAGLDARVLVALFLAGVGLPRVIQAVEKYRARKQIEVAAQKGAAA